MQKENRELPNSYYFGQEYVEDVEQVSVCFDIQFYSPAKLEPFEFFYKKKKINGLQKGQYLTVSFVEKLPRKLINDIAQNQEGAKQYVYGYIANPLMRVNQEILRQRYSLGHFLASTFSIFDIVSITLTNIDETSTDEIISIPWPPIFSAPPHSTSGEASKPEVFIRDYVDAWNDYFRGDFDNCTRRLITSVENFSTFKNLDVQKTSPWWNILTYFIPQKRSFKSTLNNLRKRSRSMGHKVVFDNLLFLYRVRNSITHGSLRIHQENGWWFCGKALETVQYFYQFLDGRGEASNGAYAFRTYGFAHFLFQQTRGITLEQSESWGKAMHGKKSAGDFIQTNKDMNEFKFKGLRITEKEKISIMKNKLKR